jgi:uncharacterized protein
MRILIASDGSEYTRGAVEMAGIIARAAHAEVTLLGVADGNRRHAEIENALEQMKALVAGESGIQVAVKTLRGFTEEQLLSEIDQHFYHLVVIGSRAGKRMGLFRMGSTARRLVRHVRTPILIVDHPRPAIKKILVCTSGEKPGESDALVGGALAALVGAEATALHVMSQVALAPYAHLEDLSQDAEALISSGAREGEHLKLVMEIMQSQGLMSARCHARVRHGLVLDEIMSEARDGDYDMVVIGAHQVPNDQFRGLRELFQENIADDILMHVQRPVLVVRTLGEGEWQIGETQSEQGQM